MQSGTPGFGMSFRTLAEAEAVGMQLDQKAEAGDDIAKLRALSPVALLDLQQEVGDPAAERGQATWLRITVDGKVLPDAPDRSDRAPRAQAGDHRGRQSRVRSRQRRYRSARARGGLVPRPGRGGARCLSRGDRASIRGAGICAATAERCRVPTARPTASPTFWPRTAGRCGSTSSTSARTAGSRGMPTRSASCSAGSQLAAGGCRCRTIGRRWR